MISTKTKINPDISCHGLRARLLYLFQPWWQIWKLPRIGTSLSLNVLEIYKWLLAVWLPSHNNAIWNILEFLEKVVTRLEATNVVYSDLSRRYPISNIVSFFVNKKRFRQQLCANCLSSKRHAKLFICKTFRLGSLSLGYQRVNTCCCLLCRVMLHRLWNYQNHDWVFFPPKRYSMRLCFLIHPESLLKNYSTVPSLKWKESTA